MVGEGMGVEFDEERNEIAIVDQESGSTSNPWTFDRVFGIATEQESVYSAVCSDLVATTLAGFNATVMVYGQTGSGKTFRWCVCLLRNDDGLNPLSMPLLGFLA
jgi:hypothetical protein